MSNELTLTRRDETENYAVITDNGGGETNIYHDVTGEVYTFPHRYKNMLKQGTKVIYHRAAKKRINLQYQAV